jgi:hypothetical protein
MSTSVDLFSVKEAASHFIIAGTRAIPPKIIARKQGQQATPPVFMHAHASAYAHDVCSLCDLPWCSRMRATAA